MWITHNLAWRRNRSYNAWMITHCCVNWWQHLFIDNHVETINILLNVTTHFHHVGFLHWRISCLLSQWWEILEYEYRLPLDYRGKPHIPHRAHKYPTKYRKAPEVLYEKRKLVHFIIPVSINFIIINHFPCTYKLCYRYTTENSHFQLPE